MPDFDARTGELKVKEERSYWRDMELSLRHKQWGYNCPAVDIDFLMSEYDTDIPIAIIEYKNENCKNIKLNSSSLNVIKELGNMAHLPVFLIQYTHNFKFNICPLNLIAIETTPKDKQYIWFSEKQYVDFLYWLRKRETPEGIFDLQGNLILSS